MRMCVRCKHTTQAPVTVRTIHVDTGPGWNVYTCPECAPRHLNARRHGCRHLEHAVNCRPCTNSACGMGRALQQVHRATRK
ncbi:hypothetical protein GCM10027073_63140 [Streptomyces chlorus]